MGEEGRTATVIAALVAGLTLQGCSMPGTVVQSQTQEQMEPAQRKRLIQVARDLGWPDGKIEEMGKRDLEEADVAKLMRALRMLDHLEEKYRVPFRAVELASPSILGSTWRMIARAEEGSYNGEEVECRWLGGQTVATDDFLSRVRGDELQELMAGVVEKVSDRMGVSVVYDVVVAHLQIGDEVNLTTPVEELSRHAYPWAWIYLARDVGLDDAGFEAFASGLSSELAQQGVGGGYHLRHLLTGPEKGLLTLDDAQGVVWDGVRGRDWELLYTGSAKGWG